MLYNVIGTAIIGAAFFALLSLFYYTGEVLYTLPDPWGLKTFHRKGPTDFDKMIGGILGWAVFALGGVIAAGIFAAGGHLARYLFRAAA